MKDTVCASVQGEDLHREESMARKTCGSHYTHTHEVPKDSRLSERPVSVQQETATYTDYFLKDCISVAK